jgi:hypothetical protein
MVRLTRYEDRASGNFHLLDLDEGTEMRRVNELACCLTNFGECRHILDGVHFLNARWIEVSETQIVKTSTTQVRVVASVQKTPSQIF